MNRNLISLLLTSRNYSLLVASTCLCSLANAQTPSARNVGNPVLEIRKAAEPETAKPTAPAKPTVLPAKAPEIKAAITPVETPVEVPSVKKSKKEKPADAKKFPAEPPLPNQQPAAEPASKNDEPPQMRSAVLKGDNNGAAGTMGRSEMDIVRQLTKLNSEQIQEFATTYARLGNKKMANLLVAELFRRDANDPVAAKLKKEIAAVSQLPDDPVAVKAQQLLVQGKAAEAATLFAQLKNKKSASGAFRYQQDYAYALLQSGQTQAAEAAFKELLTQAEVGEDAKNEASKTLRDMALDALLKRGHGALTAKDARNAMSVADQLLKTNPLDKQGVALKAAVLSMTGHPQEAIAYLEGLKPQFKGNFPHNRSLADSYSDDKQYDKARAIYTSVANSSTDSAEDKADAKRRLKELDRDQLIVAGFDALTNNNVADAESNLDQLKAENANNLDVKSLEASILTKRGKWTEARALLEEVQRLQGAGFDGAYALGEAYANDGDWRQAAHYLSLAEDDNRLDAISRHEAGRLGRDMKMRFRPSVSSALEGQSGQEGDILRNTTELSSGVVSDKNIFYLRSVISELNAAQKVPGGKATQPQLELAWRRLHNQGYYSEASAGAHTDGAMYGAKFGRYEGPGYAWDVSVRKGDRATDSLALESLNGRQDSVSFGIGTHFTRKFYFDARAQFRQVDIDGRDIGNGFGLNTNLGYAVLQETTKRPEISFNYFNEISRFSNNELPPTFEVRKAGIVSRDLVPDRIHRHGIGIGVAKHLTPKVVAYAGAGVSYEFESRQAEVRVGAGVEASVGKNTTIGVGVDYTTNGNARNAGGDVLMGTISVKHSF